MTDTHLAFTWSVSRGRDTYGYNIARLDDTTTGKRYTCMGGGYDMTGTVFGDWLQDVYQDRLREIATRAHTYWRPGTRTPNPSPDALYGMTTHLDDPNTVERVTVDGGCGLSAMEQIADAIGLTVRKLWNRKGHTTGFIVTDVQEG